MKLYVVERYIAGGVEYPEGMELDVSDDYGAYLQRDAPGCFSHDKPKSPAAEIPQVNRQARGGKAR